MPPFRPFRVAASAAIGFGVSLLLCLAPARAVAQHLELHVDSDPIYASLPFVLSVEASGFEEGTEPKIAGLQIAGARVTPLGVTPNVASTLTVINGQRSESRRVSYVFRFRVECGRAGGFAIPPITVEQGGKRAQSQGVKFTAVEVQASNEMALRLSVPDRPLWVGESFDVGLDWYLRRDVRGQTFVVPLFDQPDWVEIAAPASESREKLAFLAGARQIELPFRRDTAALDGASYTRFHFTARVTALKAGTLELAPARVLAHLDAGMGRDAFGFPSPRTALYKAEDVARRIVIRPAPSEGRPSSFAGAVGRAYSLEVQADRTVVRVGDPVELRLVVRGDHLEGVGLPPIGVGMGLSSELYSLPDEVPPGELLADEAKDAAGRRGGKLFRVSIRLKNANVHEIPPLSLSFFNPETARYQTVRSQPIALSVRGASVVGAADVVAYAAGAAGPDRTGRAPGAGGPARGAVVPSGARRPQATVGVDLALSDERSVLRAALGNRQVLPLEIALYGASLLVLGFFLLRLRTRAARTLSSKIEGALAGLERELQAATKTHARESAPRVTGALSTLARAVDQPPPQFTDLALRIETAAYHPESSRQPLPGAMLDEIRVLVRVWIAAQSNVRPSPPVVSAAAGAGTMMLALVLVLRGAAAQADVAKAGQATDLDEARGLYQQALGEGDLEQRAEAFAHAETLLAALVERHPDRPELLTDWGNAALGARDFGKAVLAYRRALRLTTGAERARKNLAWVRSAMPEWIPRPATGAMDSLFFWHYALSVAWRHLLAALFFAVAALLLAPWSASRDRRRILVRLAIVPALMWLALAGSLIAERDAGRDAIVETEGVTLRAADSPGAPPALPQPLPAGVEVTLMEERSGWARIALANHTEGWLERGHLALVAPRL